LEKCIDLYYVLICMLDVEMLDA